MEEKQASGSGAKECLTFLDCMCNISMLMLSRPVPNFPHLCAVSTSPSEPIFILQRLVLLYTSGEGPRRGPTVRTPRIILGNIPMPW